MQVTDLSAVEKLIQSLTLDKKERKALHRVAANAMRRVLAKNVREQKDARGNSLTPRKQIKSFIAKNGKVSRSNKVLNSIMRMSKVNVGYSTSEVGFVGKVAHIMQAHNEGKTESFTSKFGNKISIKLPKREVLGWSDEMAKEVQESIISAYAKTIKQ